MFVGHLGAGLALKRAGKSINLGVLFGAALFVDVLLAVLILLGVEHVTAPADYAAKHYLTFMFPFSHGLVVNIMWSALAFLICRIFTRSKTNTNRYSAIVAVAVFSHFVLDVIVHVPDMPVLGQNSPKLGFGLWEHLPLALLFEVSIACLGLYIYLRTVPLSRMKQAILADVLITSNAIGWQLEDELREIERVVKPGGYAIHLFSQADNEQDSPFHSLLTSPTWQYACSRYKGKSGWKGKYWKQIEI